MKAYKFILEPYKGAGTRYACPQCKDPRSFVRYIHSETGETISPEVGICNHKSKCQYNYTPKQFFQDHPNKPSKSNFLKPNNKSYKKPQKVQVTYISKEIFDQSLTRYEMNHFVSFLTHKFGQEQTKKVIDKFYIGTSKHWSGSTVFWQIDQSGQIRTGKIMLYNPGTGKRIKEPFNHITWAHKALKLLNFNLQQCLFGEHQLKHTDLPVAVVESEKTAIICSLYLPQYTWLACGSSNNLSLEKCQALKGKKIILFPDLKVYDNWLIKSNELKKLGPIKVSDLLEINSNKTDWEKGLDLADYLLKFDLIDFQNLNFSKNNSNIQINIHQDSDNGSQKLTDGEIPIRPEKCQAYLDQDGRLLIETPLTNTFTVYPSVKAYNDRYRYPEFILKTKIDMNVLNKIFIDLSNLTIET